MSRGGSCSKDSLRISNVTDCFHAGTYRQSAENTRSWKSCDEQWRSAGYGRHVCDACPVAPEELARQRYLSQSSFGDYYRRAVSRVRVAAAVKYPEIAPDIRPDSRRGKGRIAALCNPCRNARSRAKRQARRDASSLRLPLLTAFNQMPIRGCNMRLNTPEKRNRWSVAIRQMQDSSVSATG